MPADTATTARHPFLQGLSKHRGAPPTILVIFGASGDLTARKLIPAIYNLAHDNLLPADFHLIGFGRQPIPDDTFRANAARAIHTHSRREPNPALWQRIARNTTYLAGAYDDPAAHARLAARIATIEKTAARELQTLLYISTPPALFAPIIQHLGATGLAAKYRAQPHHTKIIIEKPFGRDLATARALNTTLRAVFDERQVYRIDHYLGKETVQDLLVQRFANAIFEPLWNRNYIDHVQITVAEDTGVGARAGYYETAGALRDMIQNHTMQLLALTAMEPPVSLNAEDVRDEKVKVLKAIQPLRPTGPDNDTIRAQYAPGLIAGKPAPAYHAEPGIAPGTTTETYAALRLSINNWRWQGVPFYLRSGKCLARRVTEIAIQFKRPPGTLFTDSPLYNITPDTLAFQIQPDEGLSLILNGKVPGLETRTQPVKVSFKHSSTFGSNTPEAYERLILDAMTGDGTLFIRGDEAETSWQLYTPVLEAWAAADPATLDTYPAGSWGPDSADALLARDNRSWRKP